ncbi:hypothetical protein BDP55DRAFT_508244, partial [Colletotrichum godetiae]
MKLVHCTTGEIDDHSFPPKVKYAILSHVYSTPGHDEWDAYDSGDLQDISRKTVIDNACLLARRNGLKYIWIDSLCINKESFDEVSDTINSLWRYFEGASICLVYLFDLPCSPAPYECVATWKQSLFWARSWSLQELLFPTRSYFYDCNWHFRGDTSSHNFQLFLGRVTDWLPIGRITYSASVARKMSWAAGKKDTRGEDSSYALLGIFDVTMPIMYGEGKELAFRNLQEAILDKTGDMSLFVW